MSYTFWNNQFVRGELTPPQDHYTYVDLSALKVTCSTINEYVETKLSAIQCVIKCNRWIINVHNLLNHFKLDLVFFFFLPNCTIFALLLTYSVFLSVMSLLKYGMYFGTCERPNRHMKCNNWIALFLVHWYNLCCIWSNYQTVCQ